MTPETFLSLCLFAFVTSITPGPNNAMLLASGVNFGLRRTVPHLLGVTLGFTFMQLALGLGVGYIFKAVPGLYPTLRALGAAYLLYLAWRIANATPPAAPASAQAQTIGTGRAALETRPMTFMEASVFQWVNPKAIMMCVTAVSTYAPPDQPVAGALLITAVFFFAGMPCVALWAVTGSSLRGFLADRRRLRAFNWAMAMALVASMAPLVGDAFQDGLF